jgi:hypothetical protein
MSAHDRRNARPRKILEHDRPVALESRVAALPEWGARGKGQHVRQQVARDVHHVDHELAILDPHVDVGAEDEQLLREVGEIGLHADVALQGRDLLLRPQRERVSAGGRDDEAALGREVHHHPAQPDDLLTELRRRSTDAASDLDHALVQLRLDLVHDHLVANENLGDVGFELERGGIDDLVLFLDADGERGGFHVGGQEKRENVRYAGSGVRFAARGWTSRSTGTVRGRPRTVNRRPRPRLSAFTGAPR